MPKLKVNTIYCVGRNYTYHALELGNAVPKEPIIFLKANSSVRGLEDRGKIAFPNETFHYEAEIVLKIKKDLIPKKVYGLEVISGIALGIDLTRREEQNRLKTMGLPWTTAKSFLGSAIVGCFYHPNRFPNLESISFQLKIDQKMRQQGNSKDMIFSFSQLLQFIHSFQPLKKNDLIFTGTPPGVGEITIGQEICLQFLSFPFEEIGFL